MAFALAPQRIRYAVFVIALIAIVVVLFLTASLVWSVLQIFIIAGLIALALDVPVHWQVARGVPRWAATFNLLLLLLVAVMGIISLFIPPALEQFRQLQEGAPAFWDAMSQKLGTIVYRFPQLAQALNLQQFVAQVFSGIGSWAVAARSIFATAVGAAAATILIFVTVVYTLLNPRPLLYGIRGLFPSAWWGSIDHIAAAIAQRIRAWVVGTLALALIIGILDYVALLIINYIFPTPLPFIVFFAMLGAVLEIIPIVGPIIAALLPSLVGFALNPWLGFVVLIVFILIQQLEGHVFVPLIMRKAVQLHPVSLIFALMVLSGLFGIFGGIIAVPVASALKVLYDEWYYPLVHADHHPTPPPAEATATGGAPMS
ncbi:MAG TPA: AI-2E family transporter [Armatimonadota bacterium]|jgi:predicted PurR-regulated permease PerM